MKSKKLLVILTIIIVALIVACIAVRHRNETGLSETETLGIAKYVVLRDRFTVHPLECISWKKIDSTDDHVTWQATKEWGGDCPAYSPDAPGIPELKVSRKDGSVMFQSEDAVFRPINQ